MFECCAGLFTRRLSTHGRRLSKALGYCGEADSRPRLMHCRGRIGFIYKWSRKLSDANVQPFPEFRQGSLDGFQFGRVAGVDQSVYLRHMHIQPPGRFFEMAAEETKRPPGLPGGLLRGSPLDSGAD